LQAKRELAAALWHAHGPDVLVRIGLAARDGHEPLLAALAPARDPADLLQRWQRLERFIHSRHRVRVEHAAGDRLLLRHVSLDARAAPSPAEDLLVFGLLIALLERCGSQGLRARLDGERHWRWSQGRWSERRWPARPGAWELRWTPAPSQPLPEPDADEDSERAHRALAADPGRAWRVQTLAAELHTSPRSLQRALAAAGSGFTMLLSEVRARHAGDLLASGALSTAEIGYVCGYADQAHFTREFKRHTALTPARFREQFAG
jgi:AraC-like DNA-binding protein